MTTKNLEVKVDLGIYSQEVISLAIYKFTDKCFISQNKTENEIQIAFIAKSEETVDTELLAKEFENELIDQQIRLDTERRFGHIRNLIVEKAFSPIS